MTRDNGKIVKLQREETNAGPRVTRDDWLNVARDILLSDGVAEVKVLTIGERLQVARSSFYWYFKSRKDLLDALLADWEATNTAILVRHCEMPAQTITGAVCNFFRCFVDPALFDQRLDFAVREWARRDGSVRRVIDRADDTRLAAVAAMFRRHGYSDYEADVRARILYFMQLGYHALDQSEPMRIRMGRLEGYLLGFTGREATREEVEAFRSWAIAVARG
ncbi:TetR/AcrR family transcriptional regulator [Defluviimonas aestuarii]|uniref:TetR/AcrR family transcriptional regulator n=1 Tax=Albidovulum aestuarii TaxID=1130726 RepID=UPI00249BFEA8|nr:TetR/AcrR family transcriptional regulator [Defluviimonas aestuarii]MDI3337145.1 TetR/AcrR family transcriptional regulator [Defluviimonas aestuarii]